MGCEAEFDEMAVTAGGGSAAAVSVLDPGFAALWVLVWVVLGRERLLAEQRCPCCSECASAVQKPLCMSSGSSWFPPCWIFPDDRLKVEF